MKKHIACMLAVVITAIAWGLLSGGSLVTAGGTTPTPTPGALLSASDYVAEGESSLEQGDYEQAIAAFSEAARQAVLFAVSRQRKGVG